MRFGRPVVRTLTPPYYGKSIDGHAVCPWCNTLAWSEKHKRRQWHPECKWKYQVAQGGWIMRSAVFERDQGVCAGCGFDCKTVTRVVNKGLCWFHSQPKDRRRRGEHFQGSMIEFDIAVWHADHIVPLWLVDRSIEWVKLQLYWLLDNLQTLCHKCHKAKTAKEAADRAKMKRIQAKGAPVKKKREKKAKWSPRPARRIDQE